MFALSQAEDIELLSLDEGNLVKALADGVEAVRTDYFSVLDDDDILLPGRMPQACRNMDAHPEADALVTPDTNNSLTAGRNGFPRASMRATRSRASSTQLAGAVWRYLPPFARWQRIFRGMPRYLEWTFLAFRLVRERRVHFCVDDPAPHFTMFDTPGSESQKLEYVAGDAGNILRMRDRSLPPHVQRLSQTSSQGLFMTPHTGV